MKTGLADINIILDRSESMETTRAAAESGFDEFINAQKKVPGEATVSLYQFDDVYDIVYEGKRLDDVPKCSLVPRGMTALLDAIGRTVNAVGARLHKTAEADRPERVIVLIVTDGMENRSQEFSRKKIKEMIEHQEKTYNWKFVFLGANQDAVTMAREYGVTMDSALNLGKTAHAFRAAFASASDYTSLTRTVGTASFTAQDRKLQDDEGAYKTGSQP